MVLVDLDGPTGDEADADADADVLLWGSGHADIRAGVSRDDDDDVGGIFLDYWISGDRISLDTIAAQASGFLCRGT